MHSLFQQLRDLPPESQRAVLKRCGIKTVAAFERAWRFRARPEQLAPGTLGAESDRKDWTFWVLLMGRGGGKTRAGAEWVIEKAKTMPESHGALVAATADDARKTMLSSGVEHIEEMSGILKVSPPDFRPDYEPSKRLLTWPNRTVATLYTAEEPDRLRGPQHHWAWVDEVAAWDKHQNAWNMLLFGLRLGKKPQACITTTPRPIPMMLELLKDERTIVSRGTTYDNRENLAEDFFLSIINRFEGTRLGRQEIWGEILMDVPGALWKQDLIDSLRVDGYPPLTRIVVAIDPAVSVSETSSETGIIVAGIGPCSCRGKPELHGFVLEDGSDKYSPYQWAQKAIDLYFKHKADRIVAEVNNGGDLVEVNVRTVDPRVPYRKVHASRGKQVRAEPVLGLYEQCIAEGELVEAALGPVPIEDIRCGDEVWTRDGLRRVLWSGRTGKRDTIIIHHDGGSLNCTPDHPVFCQRGAVQAGQLAPKSDMIIQWKHKIRALSAGHPFGALTAAVGGIGAIVSGRRLRVYNLHVEGSHEFFVGGVLVHNCRVHHVGLLRPLEEQMTTWDPKAGMPSPDRIDGLVWAITDLMLGEDEGRAETGRLNLLAR